jgi:hypothetical protein
MWTRLLGCLCNPSCALFLTPRLATGHANDAEDVSIIITAFLFVFDAIGTLQEHIEIDTDTHMQRV